MRRFLFLLGVFLCLSITARAADDAPAAPSATSPASEAAPPPAPSFITLTPDRDPWQVAVSYQYQHFSSGSGSKVLTNNGFNTDVTRYLNEWLGVEGNVTMGFCGCGGANTLFVSGGPHVAFPNKSRIEPWAQALVGLQHFRFVQGLGTSGFSYFGFTGGGGVDVKITPRFYWRVQADYLGTNVSSNWQSNYSAGSGIVLNF